MTPTTIDLARVRALRAQLERLVAAHPELAGAEAQARLGAFLDEHGGDMGKDELLSEALYLRVAPDDITRLDALAGRIPVVSRNGIARAAMRLGLLAIEKDPAALLTVGAPAKRGRKRKGAP